MERIKERNRRKAALGDRKSAAAQARMKNIATLAADERVGKKRRKGGGGACVRCDLLASLIPHDLRFRGHVWCRRRGLGDLPQDCMNHLTGTCHVLIFPFLRTPQPYHQTRKKTLRSCRPSSRSFSHMIPPSESNRRMPHSPPNAQRLCPASGHSM
jgi:hypothetical protein